MHVEVSILICSTLIDCLLFNILFKDSSLPIWRHNYPKMTETFNSADAAFERRDLCRAATALLRGYPGLLLDFSETNLYKIRIFLLSAIVDVTGNK